MGREAADGSTLDPAQLRAGQLFARLDESTTRALLANARVRRLPAGSTLYRTGEPYRGVLFILYDGLMELERADGERLPQRPGVVLGLPNYLDNEPYSSTARALDAATVLELPARELQALEAQHPALFDALNHLIAERIRTGGGAGRGAGGALARPVRSAMKSPLTACSADTPLRDALAMMQERRIGSLGVLDAGGALVALLTSAGISRALVQEGAEPGDPVARAGCEPPHTIAPEAALWQADESLQRFGVKYLVVMDDGRIPIGILSQTDILRALVTDRSTLVEQTGASRDFDALHRLYHGIHGVAREARETNRLPSRAVRILSDAHLAIQHRCVELTLEELAAAGYARPERGFAVLIMGSGGRREMLLTPDQDNGLVIADGPALADDERRWYLDFSERLNRNLDQVGYILCPGKIMARNPMFRKTLSQWREQISRLARHPNQTAARWSNIVFDFDTLYGDETLTEALRAHLLAELRERPALLEFMVEDDAEGRPPLGLFNRLIAAAEGSGAGKIDIKRNGTRIICDAARVYALSAGVASCNTTERLDSLRRQGTLSADLIDSVSAAYEELLDLLLSHQIAQAEAGQVPDKLIDPAALSRRGYGALRDAMRAVKRFQDQLQGRFGREAF